MVRRRQVQGPYSRELLTGLVDAPLDALGRAVLSDQLERTIYYSGILLERASLYFGPSFSGLVYVRNKNVSWRFVL